MRERGRASIIVIAGLLSVALVVVIFFMAKPSPADAGAQFMDALARGDVNKLTELSYMERDTPEQVRQKWRTTMEHAAKYYRFAWQLTSHKTLGEDRAAVILLVARDFGDP